MNPRPPIHRRGTRRRRLGWLRGEEILATLGAVLAFAAVYAYTGDADLYVAIAGALGMGAVTYVIVCLQAHRKSS